jgi:tetratricopeptide (TPR) repeat protein
MRKTIFAGAAIVVALAVLSGCGSSDGTGELTDGRSAYELRDFRKAEKLFSKCLQIAPENVEAMLYLALSKLALGELEPAREWASKAAAADAKSEDVKMLEAQIAWHLKDYEKAKKLYEAVAQDGTLSAQDRSLGWAGLGIVEMTLDNYHLARVAFLRAIRIDRRNASAWYHLGLLYRDGFGYSQAALEQFEIFVRLNPVADARAQRVQRTVIPELKESIARAAADRPGASKRNSALSAAAITKAESAWKRGAWKNARAAYQEALAADPLSSPAALGLAKTVLKLDSSRKGQEQALENYKLACSLRPGAVSAFIEAAALATKLGLHTQAAEIYSRAVAANPSSLSAVDGLIRSLRKVGNKTKVAQAYQLYRDSLSVNRKK